MRRKAAKVLGATVLISAGVWMGMLAGNPLQANSSSQPGSIEDPVVTKSYVDEQIAKLKASGGGGVGSTTPSPGQSSSADSTVKLEVVELPQGKILMAPAGTEVVIRVGKAVAYSSDSNGISDLTAGLDIKNGQPVELNHLLWFPRDGRGVAHHAESTGALTLIVKGNYSIR